MSAKQVSQWRTVGVVLILVALLVSAFLRLVGSPPGPGEFSVRAFDTLAWTLLGLGLTAAGKSLGEHLAQGGGIKGVARALLTDAKPGDPPATPPGAAS